MLLKNLIKNISEDKKKTIVSGISMNSKDVKKNYIFFAIKGNNINGEKYIVEAVKNGASIIVCSKNCKFNDGKTFVIRTNKIRNVLSEIASRFYKLKPKNIIAVTGTNGKTSVADIFYQILEINKIPVASIGTFGIKYLNKTIKTNLTSPDTITLHKNLHFLKKKGINNVIIEASSHGLDQKRLNDIKYKAAIFTNFSQDHLDYHLTMSSYLNAKLTLFKDILKKKSIIISDREIQPFKKIQHIAKKKNLKLIDISNELNKAKRLAPTVFTDFKLKNLSMAIEAVKLCGLKTKLIYKTIKKLKDVDGRLELIKKYPNEISVFVDYAHTPDALLKSLKSLKKNYGENITLVFGCGGDRDKKKRSLMAKIANKNCKKIFITDDNPRNESPIKIRNMLAQHIKKDKLFNIGKRDIAIRKAILTASRGEIILVAGKGHEEQQIYKTKVWNVSDKKIIQNIKLKNKIISNEKQNYLQNKSILKKILRLNKNINFNGISIDSRTIKKNNLFLALQGKKYNGNAFINVAIKKGAGCIVTNSSIKRKNKKIIRVKNPLLFLNRFANLKRKYTLAKIIAVTGSAGKTSLKNLISDLLLNFGKTYSSPKSFNNHLGVPISISNLNVNDKFGVIEIGMSKAKEIKNLTKLVKPHIGIITNIGEAHLENFKNIKGIAEAKSEIIEKIDDDGTIILNRDDKFFNYLFKKAKSYKLKIYTFGSHKKSDVRLIKIINKDNKSKVFVKINNNEKIVFFIRDLNIYNVLASIALLKVINVSLKKIKSKYEDFESSDGRGKKHKIFRYKKKFNLIDESYNANPLSVKNAINKLNLVKKEKFKKYLILGDMLELGSKSKRYHEEISKVINNSDIDKVFIKGKKTIFTYKYLNKNKRGNILQNNDDIDLSLSKIISNNDYLMIKGSNATGLNNFSKKLIRGV